MPTGFKIVALTLALVAAVTQPCIGQDECPAITGDVEGVIECSNIVLEVGPITLIGHATIITAGELYIVGGVTTAGEPGADGFSLTIIAGGDVHVGAVVDLSGWYGDDGAAGSAASFVYDSGGGCVGVNPASTGVSGGSGGHAGSLYVESAGSIMLNASILLIGGSGGGGGNGGSGLLPASPPIPALVLAGRGPGLGGAGGDGGTCELISTGGSVSAASVVQLRLEGGGGGSGGEGAAGNPTASGADGGQGGRAGSLRVVAAADIVWGAAVGCGGGDGGGGGAGGQGSPGSCSGCQCSGEAACGHSPGNEGGVGGLPGAGGLVAFDAPDGEVIVADAHINCSGGHASSSGHSGHGGSRVLAYCPDPEFEGIGGKNGRDGTGGAAGGSITVRAESADLSFSHFIARGGHGGLGANGGAGGGPAPFDGGDGGRGGPGGSPGSFTSECIGTLVLHGLIVDLCGGTGGAGGVGGADGGADGSAGSTAAYGTPVLSAGSIVGTYTSVCD